MQTAADQQPATRSHRSAICVVQVGQIHAVSLLGCSLRLHDLPDFRGWTATRQLDVSGLDGLGFGDDQLTVRAVMIAGSVFHPRNHSVGVPLPA